MLPTMNGDRARTLTDADRRRWCGHCIGLLVLILVGCRPEAASRPESSASANAVAEAAWEEQVRAVRDGQVTEIRTTKPVTADQWRALEQGCEALTVLDVESLDATDELLSLLGTLPQLERLRIGSPVGDEGLQALRNCRSLRMVNLPEGRFTDAGLMTLAALPEVELLRFHSPHVTDTGMEAIAHMPALRFLHLIDVPITDAGLIPLGKLTHLESFYLDGGNCTDEGLSELIRTLPKLHFHWDQLHLPGDPHSHPH
ncbi:MAG: hypothetical protein KF861_05350 [Planctomycetaceae bacterium]|nr:hypothetical protein [Planctomycetaceae bacterium]